MWYSLQRHGAHGSTGTSRFKLLPLYCIGVMFSASLVVASSRAERPACAGPDLSIGCASDVKLPKGHRRSKVGSCTAFFKSPHPGSQIRNTIVHCTPCSRCHRSVVIPQVAKYPSHRPKLRLCFCGGIAAFRPAGSVLRLNLWSQLATSGSRDAFRTRL